MSGSPERSERLRSAMALCWIRVSGCGFLSCCAIHAFTSLKSTGSSSSGEDWLSLVLIVAIRMSSVAMAVFLLSIRAV